VFAPCAAATRTPMTNVVVNTPMSCSTRIDLHPTTRRILSTYILNYGGTTRIRAQVTEPRIHRASSHVPRVAECLSCA
jgi:hypothetical protein